MAALARQSDTFYSSRSKFETTLTTLLDWISGQDWHILKRQLPIFIATSKYGRHMGQWPFILLREHAQQWATLEQYHQEPHKPYSLAALVCSI